MRLMPKQTLNVSYSLLFIMTVLCKYIKSKRRADPVCANISLCKKSCLFSQKIVVIDLLPKLVVYGNGYSWGVNIKNVKHFRKPSH